jgi:hypothetical protein
MKRTITVIATAVVAIVLAVAGVSTAATASTTTVKYNDTFTYNGAGSWTVVNGDNSSEIKNIGPTQSVLCSSNIGGAHPCVDGATYTFVSNARGGVNGAQNCAYLQIEGGMSGSQDTVPGDPGKSMCAAEPVSATATAAVSTTTPTCSAGETLVLTSFSHASFGTPAYGTTASDGSRSYSVVATTANGYTFSDGTTTKEFKGTLAGANVALCSTGTNTCITRANATFSYTFTADDAGKYVGGAVTVTGPSGSAANAALCPGAILSVRSTTWNYILPTTGAAPSWSQSLDGTPQDVTVNTLGSFPYAAPDVTGLCQQHDIYATFDTTGFAALTVPTRLDGPGNPYEPAFLHDALAGKGPNPTYSYDPSTGCTAQAPVASLAAGVCYWDAGQQASFKTATLTFDNSGSTVPVAFAVAGWSVYDRTVPAGQVVTEPIQASWTGGVGYTVTAAGMSFPVSIPAYASCPPTIQTCTATTGPVLSTNLAPNGWTFTETRADGHNVYVAGGLHVSTDGSADVDSNGLNLDKAAGYYTLTAPIALSAIGTPSMDYTSDSGSLPGIRLTIDTNGDGVADADLVYQAGMGSNGSSLDGSGSWWATKDLGVNDAGAPNPSYQKSWGSLEDYLKAYPNAQITAIGYSLGSGAKGDGVITGITAGCATYIFDATHTSTVASVTFQDLCGTASDAVFIPTPGVSDHYSYSTDDERDSSGVGTATVTALAESGYAFPAGSTMSWSHTFQSDASLNCATLTGDPTAHAPLCSGIDDTVTSGYITVTTVDGISYTIHDDADGASTIGDVTVLGGNTKLAAGSYTVTASALPGYTLTSAVTRFPLTIGADPVNCQLTTHAFFTPSVGAYSPVCSNGEPTSGGISITTFADPLNYFVNGEQLTAANTPMPAGAYSVLAVAANPGDALDTSVPNPMTVVVPSLAAGCAELATLAFTGGLGPSVFLIGAAILLLLGGVLIRTRKPRRPRRAA